MPNNNILTDQKLLDKLQQLQQDYVATLPADIESLSILLDTIRATDSDNTKPILMAMHQTLHRMAGSSGSFGLHALSDESRRLDHQIQGWLQNQPDNPRDYDITTLQASVANLMSLLQTTGVDHSHIACRSSTQRIAPDSMTVWLAGDNTAENHDVLSQLSAFSYDCRLVTPTDIQDAIDTSQAPRVLLLDFDSETDRVITALDAIHSGNPGIIVLSRHDRFDLRIQAVRLQASGFFLKPIAAPQIAECINQILNQEQKIPERVLIIDDDAVLADRIRVIIEAEGMEAKTLDHPESVLSALESFRPDMVLMDLYMPDYSGLEIAGVIRQHNQYMNLPIIYLSGETNPDKQMEAVRNGADDFLVKPVSDVQLIAAIRSRIYKYRLLESQIQRDSLTGLLRHSMTKNSLINYMLQAKRRQQPMSFAMIDIDHFKSVNDTHGHAVGDSVIGSIATLLKQHLRATDIIGRYGGEEFLVGLSDCSQENALKIMNNIRERIFNLHLSLENGTLTCTVSIGISSTDTLPNADADQLIEAADQAMYQAKHNGRNRVNVFHRESSV